MRPSGLKATLETRSVWPRKGWPSCLWLRTSQSRTVPSSPAEASVRPSGLKATLVDGAGVAAQRLAERLWRAHVPEPHRPVVAGGGERVPVRAEGDAVDGVGVAAQRLAELPGGCARPTAAPCPSSLPEASVRPSGLKATLSTAPVWPRSGGRAAGGVRDVPQPHRPVVAGGGERAPVRAEGDADDRPVWSRSGWPSCWWVPTSHSRTPRRRSRRRACARPG